VPEVLGDYYRSLVGRTIGYVLEGEEDTGTMDEDGDGDAEQAQVPSVDGDGDGDGSLQGAPPGEQTAQ